MTGGDAEPAVIPAQQALPVPAAVVAPGDGASIRYLEFFAARSETRTPRRLRPRGVRLLRLNRPGFAGGRRA